jgi:D-serine deaminase-like pyridoxal phosphate-dependent protein
MTDAPGLHPDTGGPGSLLDLRTPCALVDRAILDRNTERMAARATRLDVRLRPHVKTHTCVPAARLQVRGHFGGITVSTLAEARYFAEAGFGDITHAFPFPMAAIEDAVRIAHKIERLTLLVDQESTLEALDAFCLSRGERFSVMLKVDCGYHRAGVDPRGDEGIALALRLASSPHLEFGGILAHAGHAYACRDADEIRTVAAQERDVTVEFGARLRAEGLEVPEVSIGSTPTIGLADDLEGVTEVRPGNYAFHDVFQATIGTCALDDVAFSVLASVVGRYPDRGALIVDAGALALSKDPGPVHVDPDCGFGVVVSEDGRERHGDLRVVSLSQEHGVIRGAGIERFPVGSRLRILPNHSCLAAASFDRYRIVNGDEIVDEWRPVRGW